MFWLGCDLHYFTLHYINILFLITWGVTLHYIAFYTISYNLGCNITLHFIQYLITWGVIIIYIAIKGRTAPQVQITPIPSG